MTVTAVIAEYNPFHNGHKYHLAEARRRTDADFLIVVMSGDFVQRGEPAIIDKYSRAEAAVRAGADLVLELPSCYACASAEYFAGSAVSLLNDLGCVDYLCFGSECGDLTLLSAVAEVLAEEPENYRRALRDALKTGTSFPRARQEALAQTLAPDAAAALSQPNDILAVEYLKALKKTDSRIRPVVVRRAGNGYHSERLDTEFPSASAIRAAIRNMPDPLCFLQAAVPEDVYCSLSDAYGRSFPLVLNDFSLPLHVRLLSADSWENYTEFFDVPESLARRIFRLRGEFADFDSFASLVCTRSLTEAHVRRALLHILLDVPASLPGLSEKRCYYAKLLGLRRDGCGLLTAIKKNGRLPLLSKPADAPAVLSRFYTDSSKADALRMLRTDRHCSDLYRAVLTAKFGTRPADECARGVFIL